MTARLLASFIMLATAAPALPPILVHGHRGARSLRPENTLAAFEYAIAAGADVIELDLAVTRDNVLVVSHDPILDPRICTGGGANRTIREMTLNDLRRWDCGSLRHPDFPAQQTVPGARIPTLDEVLELASRGNFHFNIETKISPLRPALAPPPEEFARLVVEAVRRHGLVSRSIIQSFDFRTLHAVRRLEPMLRLAALYSGKPRPFADLAQEAQTTIVAPHFSLVTRAEVEAAHRAGLEVVPWTANRPEEWQPLVEVGVDAIITDDPAALIAYLKERGRR